MDIKIVIHDDLDNYQSLSRVAKMFRECLLIGHVNDEIHLSSDSVLLIIDFLEQIGNQMDSEYLLVAGGSNYDRTE